MVRFALSLPDGGECGEAAFALELAVRAEQAGWAAVLLEDYVTYQGDPTAPTCDAWTVLGAIATRTSHILLGTSVTPVPRRRPWNVARQAAAVDQISGGRVVLGVGIGDNGESITSDASLSRFGETLDRHARAEMLDEGLTVIDGLWRGEPFTFAGQHYRIDEITFQPRPVQRPRIPIWVGGGYPLAGPTQRALRWDGSMLYKAPQYDPDEIGMTPQDVRELRALAGERPFTIAVGGNQRSADWNAERAHIAAVADAGADWWMEWIAPADRATMRQAVDRGPLQI